MYINMTPDKTNKTLHASQDDTIRQFKFKLVDDSQVLDTSDSTPPVIFEVEPNGVEQLLPVNSSSPTTSPIIADIQYPDELRQDQEFTERITPTTIKGQAKVEKIKGNTLVFNQLSGTEKQDRVVNNTTCVANGDGSFTLSTNDTTTTAISLYRMLPLINIPRGHIFYLRLKDTETSGLVLRPYTSVNTGVTDGTSTEALLTATNDIEYIAFLFNVGTTISGTLTVKPICIDLTLMFGAGNEPSLDEFKALFPLNYYDYNAGSLLSFNGTGLKIIGKNLFNVNSTQGDTTGWTNVQASPRNFEENKYYVGLTRNNYYSSAYISNIAVNRDTITFECTGNGYGVGFPIKVKANTKYYLSFTTDDRNSVIGLGYYDIDGKILSWSPSSYSEDTEITTPENCYWCLVLLTRQDTSSTSMKFSNIQLEIGEVETTYESYTENTIDLPISTYFPNGMKSAGSVYDELTKNNVTTRIGAIDLGSLIWNKGNALNDGSGTIYFTNLNPYPSAFNAAEANIVSSRFIGVPYPTGWESISNGQMFETANGRLVVGADSSYADGNAFKQAMTDQNVKLFYELATPTEEVLETYDLVSEDIEIPLEYDNGFLVCESDGLTSKAGFIPCKVKMVKGDETLYSQLINLHVERKP